MNHTGTVAVVTGASSGIGAEFARHLSQRGADVVLVGRRAGVLGDLGKKITAETGRNALPIALDLARPGAAARLVAEIDAAGWAVDTLVNCAGAGLTKSFSETTAEELDMQIQLDIGAVVEISHAFLPRLVASGRGALVNVGSLTGYAPVPMMAVYAAAKSFVIRFTEALSHELRDSSLRVMVVSPGPTSSEFFARSGTSTTGARFQTPAQVVAEAMSALDRRRVPASIVSGAPNRMMRRLVGLLPTGLQLRLATSTGT